MHNSRIVDFLATAGIYEKLDISVEDHKELNKILSGNINYSFNLYCPECKHDSVFSFSKHETYWRKLKGAPPPLWFGPVGTPLRGFSNAVPHFVEDENNFKFKQLVLNNPLNAIVAHCALKLEHEFYVFFTLDENTITKVGQYPNVNRLQYPKISKYEKMLDSYFIELKTALNLNVHNVGVGSYVYIRRVFEKIIFDKFLEFKEQLNIDETTFSSKRFDEKIEVLKDFLPKSIIKNKGIYAILSKGIHELDEDECNSYFTTLFKSITMILDEIIKEREYENEQVALANSIAIINGKLKSKKPIKNS